MEKVLILTVVTFVMGFILTDIMALSANSFLEAEINGDEDRGDTDYYRLPKGVTPLTYTLRIIPFLEPGNFTFKGDVKIKVFVQSARKIVKLHSKGLKVDGVKILEAGPPEVEIPLENFRYEKDQDLLVLESKMVLRENVTYEIFAEFKGDLNTDNFGFYRSSYMDKSGKLQWLATTQFESLGARMAFPCFDEPHLKANFTIRIARQREMNSLSNMDVKGPPIADPNLPENYVWDNYMDTPRISTYLVAFIVSKFTYKQDKRERDVEFRVWAREEYIQDVEYSLEIGPKILEVMENVTLTKYSLPKMDMVAIPDFNEGAMENWGLVTFRESELLHNTEISSSENKQRTAGVVAHELAHQWFGDLVSPEWWTWTWLNEGFATFFSKFAVHSIMPSWNMMEQFVVEDLQTALLSDSDETHPMNYYVRNPDEIWNVFDDISYKKAGSVIRMMANFLSGPTFSRGLRRYLLDRQYHSANDSQLFQAMDLHAAMDHALPDNYTVSLIMKSWTSQAGYPLITVKRDFVSGRLNMKQERFLLDREVNEKKTERWWIPVTCTAMNTRNFNETKPMFWIKDAFTSVLLESLPAEDEWVLCNVQECGFYRVNYDERNWKLLTDYLLSKDYNKIHPVNRAQLIDDSLNLARAGYLKYDAALNLTRYLEQETNYVPLHSAFQGFSFLDTRLSESKEFDKFEVHMRHIIKALYRKLKFEESPDDDHITKLSRSRLLSWACKYQYDNCVSKASNLFRDWKNNRIKSIPSNFKSVVYCTGVSQGGTADWNYLWKAYLNSSVATEKDLMLKSLGCSRDKTTILGLLNMATKNDTEIRKHDITTVFSSVCNSPEGLGTAIKFLIDRFQYLLNMFGEKKTEKIIKYISSKISSKGQAIEMTEFLERIENGSTKASAQSAVKMISRNLAWTENYGPIIESWLKEKYSASSTIIHSACSIITILLTLLTFYV